MRIKIRIQTPKGHAAKTEKRIKPFIFGFQKAHAIYVNKDDSEIYWEVEGQPRKVMKIIKKVYRFDTVVQSVMKHKQVQKRLNVEQKKELKDMLENHTTCEIIKEATLQEIHDGKTFWERVKEKFVKKED